MDAPDAKSSPPGDVRRIDVTPRVEPVTSAQRCPFCHDPVHLEVPTPWVACAACLARHHGSCWTESGRCGACGHEARLRPDAPRRGALGLLAAGVAGSLLTLLLALGFAGATQVREADLDEWAVHAPAPPVERPVERSTPVTPPPPPRTPGAPEATTPDLSHVRVGQRYVYELQNNMQQVWTVREVGPDSVKYEMAMIMGGNPLGDPTTQEWRVIPPAEGTAPWTPTADMKVSREQVTVSGIELDCMVVEASGYRSWTTMTRGSDRVTTFPGMFKTIQLSDDAVVCGLKTIEPPR